VPTYKCPKCGSKGEPGVTMPEHPEGMEAFEIRGQIQGKHVFKCRQCGAGLLRRGMFSNRLTVLPSETWQEMERQWTHRRR